MPAIVASRRQVWTPLRVLLSLRQTVLAEPIGSLPALLPAECERNVGYPQGAGTPIGAHVRFLG
jgi:hypothetical protein